MEEQHMNNGCGKASKTNAIRHGKEGAKIKRAFTLISLHVKVKVGVYNS